MSARAQNDAAAARRLVLRRTIAAPRALLWEVFTTPAHVRQWYGGDGFANARCEMDVRVGGSWRHEMITPDGARIPLSFVFVDVVVAERLSWRAAEDTSGAEHPTPLMTVTFVDVDGGTALEVVAEFASDADVAWARAFGFLPTLEQGLSRFTAVALARVP